MRGSILKLPLNRGSIDVVQGMLRQPMRLQYAQREEKPGEARYNQVSNVIACRQTVIDYDYKNS